MNKKAILTIPLMEKMLIEQFYWSKKRLSYNFIDGKTDCRTIFLMEKMLAVLLLYYFSMEFYGIVR